MQPDADDAEQPGRCCRRSTIPVLSRHPGDRAAAVRRQHRRLPDVRADHRGRRRGCSAPAGGCAPARSASTRRRPTPSASRCSRMRYRNVILGGAVAGLGGAYFTLGSVGAFAKNITSGQGLHRAGRPDLRSLEPARSRRRGTAVRLRLRAAERCSSINVPSDPVELPARCCRTSPRSSRWPGWSAGCGHRPPTASRMSRADRPELAATDRLALRCTTPRRRRCSTPTRRTPASRSAPPRWSTTAVVVGLQRRERGVRRDAVRRVRARLRSCTLTGGGRLTHFVCVDGEGDVLMPCGRCRQLLWEHGGAELLVMTRLGRAHDGRGAARRVRARRPARSAPVS